MTRGDLLKELREAERRKPPLVRGPQTFRAAKAGVLLVAKRLRKAQDLAKTDGAAAYHHAIEDVDLLLQRLQKYGEMAAD